MVRKGLLLMAQKRLPEMTTLMVMSPRQVIECSITVTNTRHKLLGDRTPEWRRVAAALLAADVGFIAETGRQRCRGFTARRQQRASGAPNAGR
jgi:hypothetical protein